MRGGTKRSKCEFIAQCSTTARQRQAKRRCATHFNVTYLIIDAVEIIIFHRVEIVEQNLHEQQQRDAQNGKAAKAGTLAMLTLLICQGLSDQIFELMGKVSTTTRR